MLYHLHELQRRFLNPLSVWAQATWNSFQSLWPVCVHAAVAAPVRRLRPAARIGKAVKSRSSGSRPHIGDAEVPVVEEVRIDKPFCRLLHFKRQIPAKLKRPADPRVLIVAPLSGHHATLLRDTVRALLPDHDIWITDWIDARLVPITAGPFHLDDYVAYVTEFIHALGPDVHLISVCQPTVPVLAAVSLMASNHDPKLPKSMTMMGGPIDTRKSPTQVNALAMRKNHKWFENSVIFKVPTAYPGYLRKVYPGFLQHAGFVAMNPDRHLNSHWDYYLDLVKATWTTSRTTGSSTTSTTR